MLSTALTGVLCLALVYFESPSRGLTMGIEIGISLASMSMWAVLYGMTPEMFTPDGMVANRHDIRIVLRRICGRHT